MPAHPGKEPQGIQHYRPPCGPADDPTPILNRRGKLLQEDGRVPRADPVGVACIAEPAGETDDDGNTGLLGSRVILITGLHTWFVAQHVVGGPTVWAVKGGGE